MAGTFVLSNTLPTVHTAAVAARILCRVKQNSPDKESGLFFYSSAARRSPPGTGGEGGWCDHSEGVPTAVSLTRSIGQYIIKMGNLKEIMAVQTAVETAMADLRKPDAAISHSCRAKYYFNHQGTLTLACVQQFSTAKFRESGWERIDELKPTRVEPIEYPEELEELDEVEPPKAYHWDIQRAVRRAKINAFDLIMSNLDLDIFVTFTYSPERVTDKADYEECYKVLGRWLSNRVQRNGLKYVMVPERTRRGDIHFHAIMNSAALRLEAATSAKTGRQLTNKGNPLWNLVDWKMGFTSAEKIAQADEDRQAVAKYIFKYMGKQMGQKIGGRYVLAGGDLRHPFYVYSDDPTEFFQEGEEKRKRDLHLEVIGLTYREWNFL